MYHSISDDKSNLSVSVNNFERQIQYLYNSGFRTVQFNSINEKIMYINAYLFSHLLDLLIANTNNIDTIRKERNAQRTKNK